MHNFSSDLLIGEAVLDFATVLIFRKFSTLAGAFPGMQRNVKG